MNLDAVSKKVNNLKNNGDSGVDYKKNFWKPEMDKQSKVRIVPSAYNEDMPFEEMYFHYGIAKHPMPSLSNYGEQDPIEEFAQELYDKGGKENWSLAGKIQPKMRVYTPVIVRGEEDQGVRLWGISKTLYNELLNHAQNEEIGDYTDVKNGFDLTVSKFKGAGTYPEIKVEVARKQSPLSEDPKQVEEWLQNQPNPYESFKKYDREYMINKFKDYLNGVDDSQPAKPTNEIGNMISNKTNSSDESENTPKAESSEKTEESNGGGDSEYKGPSFGNSKSDEPSAYSSKIDQLFK